MVSYKVNVDNEDYIDISGAKLSLGSLVVSERVPKVVREEASIVYSELFFFEKKNNLGYVKNISIRKDSILGEYIINNPKLYIKFDDVVNAYNIAVYEGNLIANELLPLFRENVSGYKEELINKYNEIIVDYIVNNFDFKKLVDKQKKDYKEQKMVVFENDHYEYKVLTSEEKRVRKIK